MKVLTAYVMALFLAVGVASCVAGQLAAGMEESQAERCAAEPALCELLK